MLPGDVLGRLFSEREVVGLKMTIDGEKRTFYFRVSTVEGPNNLRDFSLGAAAALAVAGTGWSEVQDSQSRWLLEPEYERTIYQFFFGISPGQAWVYRRYPSNEDINNLLGTRAIGSSIGYLDGADSPYRAPSALTEMFTLKSLKPSFLGYHPYGDPSSITVRLNFFITRYDGVDFLGMDPTNGPADNNRLIAPDEVRATAKVRTVGGHGLVDVPAWVASLARRS